MSKYYSKIASTIPETKKAYIIEKINKIDVRLKGKSIAAIQKGLSIICQMEDLNNFRISLFCLSKALSNHGIAPRWQDLTNACKTPEQCEALTLDAPIIDLAWLAHTFPKHKTINKRWQKIFSDGFDLELALSIANRQITTARKITKCLGLTTFQQIGCIHFLSKSKYKAAGKQSTQTFIESAKKRSLRAYNREVDRSTTLTQLTDGIARQRALICLCWTLAEESPTKAAIVYKWMTGKAQDKANITRTMKRMTKPVSRKHVAIRRASTAASET